MAKRTTRAERIRLLRALGRSPNAHEAGLALQKARELEAKTPTPKGVALAIAALLKERGLTVQVRRYKPDGSSAQKPFDIEIDYRSSQAKVFVPRYQLKITIVGYEH
jgi:hypothetical protein